MLFLYGLGFGVGLPLLVARYWNRSTTFSRDAIAHASMEIFFKELSEQSPLRRILEIVSRAVEFEKEVQWTVPCTRSYLDSGEDWKQFGQLLAAAEYEKDRPVVAPGKGATSKGGLSATSLKVHALLWAHFRRVHPQADALQGEQAAVVLLTARLLPAMIQIAVAREWYVLARNLMILSQVQETTNQNDPTCFSLGIFLSCLRLFLCVGSCWCKRCGWRRPVR